MKIGVLGLQGDVREHLRAIESLGAAGVTVKHAHELDAVDALVLPGGESTTIGKLLDRFDLLAPISERVAAGLPLYGTCAGLILMATEIVGEDDAPHRLSVLDVAIRRNGYGRQVDSFEAEIDVPVLGAKVHGVFIRAPLIERTGGGVEVLGEIDGHPVLVRSGNLLASSFHPELSGDARIHGLLLEMVR